MNPVLGPISPRRCEDSADQGTHLSIVIHWLHINAAGAEFALGARITRNGTAFSLNLQSGNTAI
jgi:hypothetical protein